MATSYNWGVSTAVAPTGPNQSCDAVASLQKLGRQYVAAIRMITFVPIALIALLIVQGAPDPRVAVYALAAVGVWSVAYMFFLLQGPSTWITLVDSAVLAGLAMSSPWSIPPSW